MLAASAMTPRFPYAWASLCWLARVLSAMSIGIVLMFAFGEPGTPTVRDWLLLAFFPIGMVLGLLLGWWQELLGGLITVGSLMVFYGLMWMYSGHLPPGPYFAMLGSPGVLFVIVGLLARANRHERTGGGLRRGTGTTQSGVTLRHPIGIMARG